MPRASCAGFFACKVLRLLRGTVPLAWYIADKGGLSGLLARITSYRQTSPEGSYKG